jgi:hypothetical protein
MPAIACAVLSYQTGWGQFEASGESPRRQFPDETRGRSRRGDWPAPLLGRTAARRFDKATHSLSRLVVLGTTGLWTLPGWSRAVAR